MSDSPRDDQPTFGPNAWLVDEMYDQYRRNPGSVSESWQEFFADYKPNSQEAPAPQPAKPAPPDGAAALATASASPPAAPVPKVAPKSSTERSEASEVEAAEPLRGAPARVVANMTASLAVPTATSVRPVPAKLLDRKSTRLNSSHVSISYAVFCLKKKKKNIKP